MLFIWFMPTHTQLSEALHHKLIQFDSLPATFPCQVIFIFALKNTPDYSASDLILFPFGDMPASQNL